MDEKRYDDVVIKLRQGIIPWVGRSIVIGCGSMLVVLVGIGKCIIKYMKYGAEVCKVPSGSQPLWETIFLTLFGFLFFLFGPLLFISAPYCIEVRKGYLLLKYPFFRITIPNEIIKEVIVREAINYIGPGVKIYVILRKRKFFF